MYYMKILLVDYNAKVRTENIFQPTIGTKRVHPESNDNGIRLVNFTTSKNLIEKSTKFHIILLTNIVGQHQMISQTIR
jgi:hypothetical protein